MKSSLHRYLVYVILGAGGFCLPAFAIAQDNSKPGFDSMLVAKEIATLNNRFTVDFKNGDSTSLGSFYAVDAKILHHGGTTTNGRAAVISFYGGLVKSGVVNISLITTAVWGSDNNLVVEEGTLTLALANGREVAKGRCLLTWKRVGDGLKIFRDVFISDDK